MGPLRRCSLLHRLIDYVLALATEQSLCHLVHAAIPVGTKSASLPGLGITKRCSSWLLEIRDLPSIATATTPFPFARESRDKGEAHLDLIEGLENSD